MIRIPKLSDPADMVMRNSLYRGSSVDMDRLRFRCPSSKLFNPQIPPAVSNVQELMGVDRQELADLIAKQQDRAEQEINEIRADQIEQLQGPRNAMEEYFIAQLARLRQKEIQEANNAYLTEEDKRQLALSPLRARAGIDGRFMAGAEARAEANIAQDEVDMASAVAGTEGEPTATLPSAMESATADSMGARPTADARSAMEEVRGLQLRELNTFIDDVQDVVDLPEMERDTYIRNTVQPLLAEYNSARGVGGHIQTTLRQVADLRTLYREGNAVRIRNKLNEIRMLSRA